MTSVSTSGWKANPPPPCAVCCRHSDWLILVLHTKVPVPAPLSESQRQTTAARVALSCGKASVMRPMRENGGA